MKTLELFSGSKSFSKVANKLGHKHFSKPENQAQKDKDVRKYETPDYVSI